MVTACLSPVAVVGVPDMGASWLLGKSYGGVGALGIVESGGRYRGTGVLLNDRWVLTAAHNWDAGAVRNLVFSINGQRHEAADWVQHPGWDGTLSPSPGSSLG